jgi:hypothetical protein
MNNGSDSHVIKFLINERILGRKMRHAIIKLTIDTKHTAPAAISFTCFITGCID